MTTQSLFQRFATVVLSSLLMAAVFGITPAQVTHADTLTISPPKFEIFGNPGDVVNESLKVSNDSSGDQTYQTDIEDFQAQGDNGEVALIEDKNAPKTSYSLAQWVTLEPSRFSIPAGQTKILNISIRIPRNAEPGGHYASVQIRVASDPVAGGGASVQTRLNSLILLRVSGDLTEKLSVTSLKAAQTFSQHGPIDLLLNTKNDGNIHDAPNGVYTITDMFGRKVKEIPLKTANVLPGANRVVATTWEDTNMIGKFTATLVATYGTNKTPLTATTTFYVIPLGLVWIVLGIIAFIIFLFTQRKRLKKALHALTNE